MMSTFKGFVGRISVFVPASLAVGLMLAALAAPALAAMPAPPAPEIDPGSLAGALALVGGGVMVLRARLRR